MQVLRHASGRLLLVQRHQDSYMRRELQWEATVARLQQQLAQLKGEGNHKAAEDAAEGQAKQLNTIRSIHAQAPPNMTHYTGLTGRTWAPSYI